MTTAKPLKHFCICGRGFTTSSGAKHHYVACPQEQARSAAYVAAIEAVFARCCPRTPGGPHSALCQGEGR